MDPNEHISTMRILLIWWQTKLAYYDQRCFNYL